MKTTLPLLGNISVKTFLSTYWHKKPLLIRQAIPDFTPPVSKKDLFALAKQDDVESRLIAIDHQHWQVNHGPFDKLPSAKKKNWTLLVQGVNLHHQQAHALMEQFRFIPDTRLDDLMISYASDEGGVGPHFDSYDVFLLQAHGQRRWRISNQKDLTLIDGIPLKILENFDYTEEFILNPGDMLYLPPQYAHDGVAIGECMTYSIGFRAPTYQEMGEEFLHFMADSIEFPGRYADPKLKETDHPAEIQDEMLKQLQQIIAQIQFNPEDMQVFLGRYLSEPKSNVFFETDNNDLDEENFFETIFAHGVRLSPKSRMLYKEDTLFINGDDLLIPEEDLALLTHFANTHQLSGEQIKTASPDVLETLFQWYQDGWIVCQEA